MEDFIKLYDYDIDWYIDLMKQNKKFSFTRWGDGEWLCASGADGQNKDDHRYFPEMGAGLREALVNDKGYFKATWPLSEEMISSNIQFIKNFCDSIGVNLVNWYDAGKFEYAATYGKIKPLVNQLEKMNYIIVSESKKRNLPIKYTDFIEVPLVNCFLEKELIKSQVISMCRKYKNPVFGFSASMATNVMIDELYPLVGDKCWMIDFGSIWDPFIGNMIRSHHLNYVEVEL